MMEFYEVNNKSLVDCFMFLNKDYEFPVKVDRIRFDEQDETFEVHIPEQHYKITEEAARKRASFFLE